VLFRAAFPIGVLDPQDVSAAGMPGVQPVEERSPGSTDVEISGWGRGEADTWTGHDGLIKSVNGEP
jgi:hypothetical protein